MAKRILLIEDEDSIRDLYKRHLDEAGFSTDAIGNGKDGLQSAKQGQYDLLLLDIMLPDINGLDILKEVKQNEQTKNIPVILLTNLRQDEIIKEGFKLGAEGYLMKASFTPKQIVAEVQNILQQQELKTAFNPPKT